MDLLAQKDSWLVYALFAIGAVMLVYTLYLLVEQRRSLVFEVSAPVDGTVKAISAVVGTAVNTDDLLVTLG